MTLRDEQAQLEATFLPGAGMLCSSLRHRGEELLAQNRGVEAYVERGKTMGIPLLYPWANRLAGFDYTVAGRNVAVPHDTTRVALDDRGLPIHGVIGGRMAWELTGGPSSEAEPPSAPGDAEAGAGGAPGRLRAQTLTALLSWSESRGGAVRGVPVPPRPSLRGQPAGRTPGDRSDGARVRAGHGAGGVRLSPLPLPAGHPTRALAGGAAGDARPLARRPPDPDRPRRGAVQPRRSSSPSASSTTASTRCPRHARFAVEAADRRLELELLEGYPCAQVYAPRPGEFICFEPMTAPANALRSGDHLRLLAPGESCRARFALSCVAAG